MVVGSVVNGSHAYALVDVYCVAISVAASALSTLNVLSNEAFIAYASDRAQMKLVSVDVNRLDSGGFTSVVRREAKPDLIPANFRSFVGATIELRQTEAWAEPVAGDEGRRFGTFDLEIVGAPVRISGRVALTEADGASQLVYSGDIVASVPLFGSTIEKAVGGAVQDVLSGQQALIEEWLTAQN